jgi:hypothetical protein
MIWNGPCFNALRPIALPVSMDRLEATKNRDPQSAVPPDLPGSALPARSLSTVRAGPVSSPPLPGEPGCGHSPADPPRRRWATILFGVVPATYLAIPAGIGVLLGFVLMTQGWIAAAVFLTGAFGWAGVVSLWLTAGSGPVIGRNTAIGLILGIVGAVLFALIKLLEDDLAGRLRWFPLILVVGPIWVAIVHLNRFRLSEGMAALAPSCSTPRPPPSETSTWRVGLALKLLLLVDVFVFCLVGATLLAPGSGWGQLFAILLGFPFALGVVVFCVWSFIQFRPLRGWVIAVVLAPAAMFAALQTAVHFFGEPTVTMACRRAAPWLPVATIFLFPRTVGALIPKLLKKRGFSMAFVILESLMLLPWIPLLFGWRPWEQYENMVNGLILMFTFGHAVLGILVGLFGSFLGYVSLFRNRGERFVGLSVAQIVQSLLLLLIGLPIAWFAKVITTSIG